MGRNNALVTALCPFYKFEKSGKENWICCDGFKNKRSKIRYYPGSLTDLKKHSKLRCCGNWQKCPIAVMLWQEFDE